MQCKIVIGTCTCMLYKHYIYRHLYNALSGCLIVRVYTCVHIKYPSVVLTKHVQVNIKVLIV